MAHIRQQIRERAGTALAGLSLTGSNVFESRLYPLIDEDLPCILVSVDSEEIDYETTGDILRRNVLLTLIVKAQATADIDDVMDSIGVEVEAAMAGESATILSDSVLINVEVDLEAEGEQPQGALKMSYQVTVFTTKADPETNL